jgi:hypothetical protein
MIRIRFKAAALATTLGLAAAVACAGHVEEGGHIGKNIGLFDGSIPPEAPCKSQDPICYVAGPQGPGNECMAVRDNSLADHVQFRQTWSRSVKPEGNTNPTVYAILSSRGHLPLPQCNTSWGTSGYILLTDWDRSNPDPLQQTLRTGFANFVADGVDAIQNGMCFAEFMYSDPTQGLPAPGWHVKPVTSKRRAADFTVEEVRGTVPEGEGTAFINESTGYIHGYSPLVYVLVFSAADRMIAIPIRDVEVKTQFNDKNFNCVGRWRAEALNIEQKCQSAAAEDPPWGCVDDECPDFGCERGDCPETGRAPSFTRGHFRIVELEQIYSGDLSATLCVTYPGQPWSVENGWAVERPEGGVNCSGSAKWNPSDPVNGLPMGDWCSATNSPATSDCHDAWLSESYAALQAFPVQGESCLPQGATPPPG